MATDGGQLVDDGDVHRLPDPLHIFGIEETTAREQHAPDVPIVVVDRDQLLGNLLHSLRELPYGADTMGSL